MGFLIFYTIIYAMGVGKDSGISSWCGFYVRDGTFHPQRYVFYPYNPSDFIKILPDKTKPQLPIPK